MSRKRHPPIIARSAAFDTTTTDWHGIGTGWHQLLFPTRGAVRVTVGDKQWVVPPGQGLWIGAGVRHRIRTTAAVGIRAVFFPIRTPGLPSRLPRPMRITPLLRELLRRVLELETLNGGEPAHHRLLAVLIDELREYRRPGLQLRTPVDPRAAKAAALVRHAPRMTLSLRAAASQAATSARTLARLFRAETGMGFGAWQRQARLAHAVQLLGDGHSVGAVARAVGYESTSAFIAAFKQVHQVTPARYLSTEQPVLSTPMPGGP